MNKRFLILSIIVFLTGHLFAQSTVKGVIKNESGETVPGVTIMIKSSKTGTTTDIDGKYSIKVSPNDVLVFSAVGMKKQEIAVGTKSQIDVVMAEDTHTLEEAVVVGYGSVKKVHLTGSVASISSKEIEDLPVGNLAAALSGRLTGVSVSGGTSRPGAGASITIRNTDTWGKDGSQGKNPLYVIDDVVYPVDNGPTAFNELDPSEVESISVLKDASAAVYGSRAANGVVVVKTKRGKNGKPKISYNGSYGIESAVLPKMMNAYEYATYMNDYYYTANNDKSNSNIYSDDELEYFKTHSWNWLDQAWKNSNVSRHSLNISGGSDNATYFAGASYFTQDGNYQNLNYDKWTFRASTDINIASGFKIGLALNGSYDKNHKFLVKISGGTTERDYQNLVDSPPDTPPYVNGFAVANNTSTANSSDNYHFFEVAKSNAYIDDRNTALNFNINAEYAIPFIKGLKINGQYARMFANEWEEEFGSYYNLWKFNMIGGHSHIYNTPSTVMSVKNSDRLLYSPTKNDNYQLNGGISYGRKIGLHEFNIMSTVEQSETSYKKLQVYKDNIYTGGNPEFGLNSAYGTMDGSTSYTESGSLSVAGRANYNYAGKYLLEFAYRFDSSTKFSSDNYWGFFPSFSAGWIISEENFFKKSVPFINFLKVRGSAGFLGTDNAKAWVWKQRYTIQTSGASFGNNSNTRNPGLKLETQPNPDITWDHIDKFNLGIDSRLFDNRLSATIEGFFDHGYDLLTQRQSSTPLTVGGTMPDENMGVRNDWGMEFQFGWEDKIGEVNYNISTHFGWNNDVVIVKDQAAAVKGTWQDIIGKSSDYGTTGYHCTGMLRTQADVDKLLAQNPNYTIFGLTPAPGMLNYKDIRGAIDASGQYTGPDGKIDANDLDYISKTPHGIHGFTLDLGASWKGLKVGALLNCSWGDQQSIESDAMKHATTTVNRPQFWRDHWTPTNTNAKYPNPYYSDSYEVASDFWFVNSFVLKIKSFDISYTLPKKITNRLKIDNLRVYVSAMDPCALYNPYDYRSVTSGNYHNYPNLSAYTMGISLSL